MDICSPIQSKLCGHETCEICKKRSFASHGRARFWSEKNDVKPIEVFKGSGKKYYFNCECGHETYMIISDITSGRTCVYCTNQKLCNNDNCVYCMEKSFQSHPRANYWSIKNEITPRNVFKSSPKKYYFNCDCKHDLYMSLNDICSNGNSCAYCSNQKLCDNQECLICMEKSFQSHPRANYWSIKNEITPRNVFKNSGKKYYFICDCGHEFLTLLSNVTRNGTFCPYCSNPPKKLCDNNDCKQCYSKSFAVNFRSNFWSVRNKYKPRDIFRNSTQKYYFICEFGHEFETSLNSITNSESWCPRCVNKTEALMLDKLNDCGYIIESQKRFNWCRSAESNAFLPFDFVIEHIKIIIELDGPQHFRQISNWRPAEEQQQIDHYKMNKAILYGYTIIRILQEDVFYDRYNWWGEIQKHIYHHPTPTCIYLCKNGEYDCYQPKRTPIVEPTKVDINDIYEFLNTNSIEIA